MPKKQEFSKILKKLLSSPVTAEEQEQLKAAGFNLKSPTKQAVIVAALYKKAAAGDLSAIKELRAMWGETSEQSSTGTAVVIIDNLRGENG